MGLERAWEPVTFGGGKGMCEAFGACDMKCRFSGGQCEWQNSAATQYLVPV